MANNIFGFSDESPYASFGDFGDETTGGGTPPFTPCQIGGGCYGVLDIENNACLPQLVPGSTGPCFTGAGQQGTYNSDGYCCTGGSSGGGGVTCFPGLKKVGDFCYCPDGTNPDTSGKTLEEKCPSVAACPAGTVYDPATKKCVASPSPGPPQPCPKCPPCPVNPGCPAPPECPKCPTGVDTTAAEGPVTSLWPWLVGGTALGLVAGYLAFSPGKKKPGGLP